MLTKVNFTFYRQFKSVPTYLKMLPDKNFTIRLAKKRNSVCTIRQLFDRIIRYLPIYHYHLWSILGFKNRKNKITKQNK